MFDLNLLAAARIDVQLIEIKEKKNELKLCAFMAFASAIALTRRLKSFYFTWVLRWYVKNHPEYGIHAFPIWKQLQIDYVKKTNAATKLLIRFSFKFSYNFDWYNFRSGWWFDMARNQLFNSESINTVGKAETNKRFNCCST